MKNNAFRKQEIAEIPIDHLQTLSYYKREEIEGVKQFLRTSIKTQGLLTPILVNMTEGEDYFIVDGVARYEICKELGYTTINAVIEQTNESSEKDHHILANVQVNQFPPDFINKNLTEELLKAYLLAYGDNIMEEEQNGNLKIPKPINDGIVQVRFGITRTSSELLKQIQIENHLPNKSQALEFLINKYVNNEK